MTETHGILLGVSIAVAVLSLIVWIELFKFDECRMVGHSVLYCVLFN